MQKLLVNIHSKDDECSHFSKQLPSSPKHPWNQKYDFVIKERVNRADYLVIVGLPPRHRMKVIAPVENRIYIRNEPLCMAHIPSPMFVKKFHTVISSFPIKHSRNQMIFPGAAMMWRFRKSYDSLLNSAPQKTKLLSVVSSDKAMVIGHRKRLAFVNILKEHFKDDIDIYGRGINAFEDKWDVTAPYKYHICLENSAEEHYWSEKLSDTMLAMSYPFYWGAPNISDYFSAGSLTAIDIENPKQAIETIEYGMANNLYEKSLASREKSKDKVLNEYNLFAILDRVITENEAKRASSQAKVVPKIFRHSPLVHKLHSRSNKKLRKFARLFKTSSV